MTKEQNPWKRLGSRIVYRNSWMTLREDRVVRPDGTEGIYGVVDTRVSTGVIALTPQREVYLVGQFRYATDMYSWEIIEGGADAREDPLTAASRELREEAGLLAAKWTPLGGEVHLSNCITSEVGFFFIAEDLTETEAEPESTEILQVKKLALDEAIAMVDSGEIVDAMSIMGLLRAERFLRVRG